MIFVPIKTKGGMNSREHFMARSKRVFRERDAVTGALSVVDRPELPCVVMLTRIAPSNGLDDDNNVSALKACRDSIAEWLGVDDKDRARVRYVYAQERGEWGVRIQFVKSADAVWCPTCGEITVAGMCRASQADCSFKALMETF